MRRTGDSDLPVLHLRYIVMRHNEHEVPHVRDFAAQHFFDEVSIRTLSIIDAPEDAHLELIPEQEEYRAYTYEDGERVRRTDFRCEKAFIFPALFADGTVVVCDQDCKAQRPLGSIADGSSFASHWWGKQAAQVRATVRDHPEKLSFCRNCPFKDRPVKDCSTEYTDLRGRPAAHPTC
jgi:radical SAM protein with 4Fe4S-binding SPASM domain